MINSAQYILQHLFSEGRLEDVSVDQLKQLVDEYPSFNVGHYLLSVKLQRDKDQDYLSETQRTALYFNNPLWLQWLLQTTEEKPLANLEEIAAALRETEQRYAEKESFSDSIPTNNNYDAEYQTSVEEPIEKTVVYDSPRFESGAEEDTETENPVLGRYSHGEEEEIKIEEPVKEAEVEVKTEIEPVVEEFRVTHITDDTTYEEFVAPRKEDELIIENENNPEDTVKEVAVDNEAKVEEFRETHITENPAYEEFVQPPIEETISAESKHEEPADEPYTVDTVEHFHETHITENPVYDEFAEPAIEEIISAEVKKEEPLQQDEVVEKVGDFHETSIYENSTFEEFVEPVKEDENVLVDIKNQEQEVEEKVEDFHETYVVENTTYDESVEPVQELDHPVIEEKEQDVISEGRVQENFHAAHVDENIAFEEHAPPLSAESQSPAEMVIDEEPIAQMISETARQTAPETETEDEVNTLELSFEPYHTIDYFASQGIKFVQEENPTDKFGKQLKSFTAWLKVMKKLPQNAFQKEPDEKINAEIEAIAADSLKEKEVDTETMAEVLAKQGKIDKAIEIYLKLSLLNPTKIAYFAAKIEQVKKMSL